MSTAPTDYSKLTAPQLKALCKERKLAGYSKLTKAALQEKLRESDALSPATSSSDPSLATSSSTLAPLPGVSTVPSTAGKRPTPEGGHNEPPKKVKKKKANKSQAQSDSTETDPVDKPATNHSSKSTIAKASGTAANSTDVHPSRHPSPPAEFVQDQTPGISPDPSIAGSTNKNTDDHTVNAAAAPSVVQRGLTFCHVSNMRQSSVLTHQNKMPQSTQFLQESLPPELSARSSVFAPASALTPPVFNSKSERVTTVSFKEPILPSRTQRLASKPCAPPNAITAQRFKPLAVVRPKMPLQQVAEEERSDNLVFASLPEFDISTLKMIAMPPPLARRHETRNFTLFLSRAAPRDLKSCMLVSRHIRYAAYGSALIRLNMDFSSSGLLERCRQHKLDPSRLNLWPYLYFLRREVIKRKETFLRSSLGRLFIVSHGEGDCTTLISNKIWSNMDGRALLVALRFLLTRLYFVMSIGNSDGITLFNRCQVVKMEEKVQGLVWSVHVAYRGHTTEFYILESTGEVISAQAPAGILPVRSDWATFVAQNKGVKATDLVQHLHWSNHEEYIYGMSKVWLAKVKEEDAERRNVALRYILASVAANSYSGQYMSHADMASEFAGNSIQIQRSRVLGNRVNLFLPGHHHIESIHYTTPNKKALHPSLAIVQTPSREYYILRENGMQVGVEEEGVALIWQRLLGCDRSGCDVMPVTSV